MTGRKIALPGYVWDEKKGLRRDPKHLDAAERKKRQDHARQMKLKRRGKR